MSATHGRLIGVLVFGLVASVASGAETPVPSRDDPRVRYVTYVPNQVTEISVQRGAVTRVILESGERIQVAATGFAADCSKDELEWCIRADVGTNQLWVKPKDGATHNNLEVHTNKRDYSIAFRVLRDSPTGRSGGAPRRATLEKEPMYRVVYEYSVSVPLSQVLALDRAGVQKPGDSSLGAFVAVAGGPPLPPQTKPSNWRYSMEQLERSEDITPTLVYDDGRFTYFQFPGNREVPSIFFISREGTEGRVNYRMRGDWAVVERVSRRFVLRLGSAVVGIWNDAFDIEGNPAVTGTSVPGVVRTLRQPNP